LKSDELKLLREEFENAAHPEAAQDRSLTLQALDALDRGARNAINKICQEAGINAQELDGDTAQMGHVA
jgi:hypothetical protein